MKTKTAAETWEKKFHQLKLYRLLMIAFLVIALVGSTLAIVIGVKFHNLQKAMGQNRWISVILETKKMPDSSELTDAIYQKYQIQFQDYGSENGLVKGTWKGQTLDTFLRVFPQLFSFDVSGLMGGIKGSKNDPTLIDYWWALYSPTDPSGANDPDHPTTNGAPLIYLQDVNVFYFSLHKMEI